MTTATGPRSPLLYERIETEIRRCHLLAPTDTLANPLYKRTHWVEHRMYWQPKAAVDDIFAEAAADDPIVGVSRMRLFKEKGLYVLFRLKDLEDGPIRCIVIINGEHSIRVAIARGKIGKRRTYAETILELDEQYLQADALHVEVLRGNTLLHYAHLKSPKTFRQVVGNIALSCIRLAGFLGRYGNRLRPTKVPAKRLLEESVILRHH